MGPSGKIDPRVPIDTRAIDESRQHLRACGLLSLEAAMKKCALTGARARVEYRSPLRIIALEVTGLRVLAQ